jgi:S1-C subfamily serine protease
MSGVKVDKVFEGTATYDCGIRTGDTVLEVANVKITHALQIYSVLSQQTSKGYAEFKVLRDEQEMLHRMPLQASRA